MLKESEKEGRKKEKRWEKERLKEAQAGILVSLRRGAEGILLRGERMRSGRRDSKINRRNLSRDREISLTMRALVRAKWSERGGRWRAGVG